MFTRSDRIGSRTVSTPILVAIAFLTVIVICARPLPRRNHHTAPRASSRAETFTTAPHFVGGSSSSSIDSRTKGFGLRMRGGLAFSDIAGRLIQNRLLSGVALASARAV